MCIFLPTDDHESSIEILHDVNRFSDAAGRSECVDPLLRRYFQKCRNHHSIPDAQQGHELRTSLQVKKSFFFKLEKNTSVIFAGRNNYLRFKIFKIYHLKN